MQYRKEHGLEPMTETAKKRLCGNILRKCCDGDKELEQLYIQFSKSFIDNHFQEFYERFMKLKDNETLSKGEILRTFSDITRGDIDFGKISENIDKMTSGNDRNNKLWENRFQNWCSEMDEISQNSKDDFSKIQEDISTTIKNVLEKRSDRKEQNIAQENIER